MDIKNFKELISNKILILDGAMGTEMQKMGILDEKTAPEELNVICPDKIKEIHESCLKAGSDVVLSNTFGGNRLKLSDYRLGDRLEELNIAGVKLAKEAARKYNGLVAADIGPLGEYLSPLGKISFDVAYELFSQQVKALSKAGPDFIIIETMAEIRELKAAIIACKDNFKGPVFAQMTFTADGTTVTGTNVLSFLSVVESLGTDGIGLNCSVGPKDLSGLVKIITENSSLPVSFKPNAGMPKLINRKTVFPGTKEDFVKYSTEAYNHGVNMLGGCCGTNPEFIKALSDALKGKAPISRNLKHKHLLSSRTRAIDIANSDDIIIIGERINPTNRGKFQDELLKGNFTTLRKEAREQVKHSGAILDINVGVPNADEVKLLKSVLAEIQEVVNVPLCIDSSNTKAIEQALKSCAGKPIINSVTGEKEKLEILIPLAKRYGASLIGLTTDERGLPKTVEDRIEIAKRILEFADKYKYKRSEIIFDYLTLAISAMPGQIQSTLDAISKSKELWPENKTVLGVSNISFGLPQRQIVNSTFLKLAKSKGLNLAILNPREDWSIDDPLAKDFILGKDLSGEKYIEKYSNAPKKPKIPDTKPLSSEELLFESIVEGNKEEITDTVKKVIENGKAPIDISNEIILEALNLVGNRFNKKEYFLPQVIRSAESAQKAFSVIKPLLTKSSGFKMGKIALATVKGDVHDIGKNIVASVLESHGWEVIDLGKNVDAERIVNSAVANSCALVGLSALMTTTMLEMEKVVQLRDASNLKLKILVGGAPVTKTFAESIKADGFAGNAVEAAEVAKKLLT